MKPSSGKPKSDRADTDHSDMMQAISRASLDALITIDLHGDIVEFSPSAEKLYGYSRVEVMGRKIHDVVIPDRMHQAHKDGLARYHKTGEGPVINNRVEVPSVRRDGSEFTAELTVVPLQHQGNRYFTAFIRDISERKAQEAATEAAAEAARASADSQARFLSLISHELKTPLNSIIGGLDLLAPEMTNEKRKRFLDAARLGSVRLLELIEQLLDYSQLAGDKLQLDEYPTSLLALLHELETNYLPLAESSGIALRLEISGAETLNTPVVTDAARLRHVLSHLLHNAINYTHEGSVSLEVVASVNRNKTIKTKFVVRDTGVGIDDTIRARIGEAFLQTDPSRSSSSQGGLGIGLAISNHLVTAMGGKLNIDSTPGTGSSISFELELPIVDDIDLPDVSQASPIGQVLIVDDSQANQMIAEAILSKAGYDVVLADGGDSAIGAVQRGDVALVLMDLRMPGMDGIETTQRIRELPEPLCRVPVVALTANTTRADRESCHAAGIEVILSKPIEKSQLLNTVSQLCNAAPASRQQP